jgi:hypothetical protein
MSASDKAKLDGIQAGATAQAQADWAQTTANAADYIKNKPTIPTSNSQLTNGAGYQTAAQVSSAISAAVPTLTAITNAEIDAMFAG